MKNSDLDDWLCDSSYFSALSVLSEGPLHPFASIANSEVIKALPEGTRILEIGMGSGWTHRFFRDNGFSVVSVEPNKFMRRAAIRNGVEERSVIPFSINSMSLRDDFDSCDFIVAQAVFGFVEDGPSVLDQLLSAKKRLGVHIVDWHPDSKYGAPDSVRVSVHNLSEYIYVLEKHEFSTMHVYSGEYVSGGPPCTFEIGMERVLMNFPEAGEFDVSESVKNAIKLCTLPRVRKRAFILTAFA